MTGMKVETTELEKRLDKIEQAFTRPGLARLARQGKALLRDSTRRAFAQRRDPDTGSGWAPRAKPATWQPLKRTGTLMAAQEAEAKVWQGKFASRVYLRGTVRDAMYMTPSGAQSYHIIAGSLFYGRSTARSAKGTRLRGYTPRGGVMPARGFAGMDSSARQRLATLARRHAQTAVKG